MGKENNWETWGQLKPILLIQMCKKDLVVRLENQNKVKESTAKKTIWQQESWERKVLDFLIRGNMLPLTKIGNLEETGKEMSLTVVNEHLLQWQYSVKTNSLLEVMKQIYRIKQWVRIYVQTQEGKWSILSWWKKWVYIVPSVPKSLHPVPRYTSLCAYILKEDSNSISVVTQLKWGRVRTVTA